MRETGLFRTQRVDGIMGMSASPHTLPHALLQAGHTASRAFGMCFRRGGGVLSLGGVDPGLHTGALQYARANIMASGCGHRHIDTSSESTSVHSSCMCLAA